MREVVLFLCHFVTDDMLVRYEKLNKELASYCDVFWALQCEDDVALKELQRRGVPVFGFSLHDLSTLGYTPIAKTLVPGSGHFVTEYFYKQHSDYCYYWVIEYDVVFTGNWETLIDAFKNDNADFIASHVESYNEENKDWPWWQSLSFAEETGSHIYKYVKSFNPIYRISRSALIFLDSYLKRKGNKGHYETVVCTALYNNGFKLQDFGGTGEFVAPGNIGRFYIQTSGINHGSMRWKPVFDMRVLRNKAFRDKLFHPIK